MRGDETLAPKVARLEALMAERLGTGKRPLGRAARWAGRELPRGVRADLARVAEAAHLAGHPRLRVLAEDPRVDAAIARAEAHLTAIDVADRRRGKLLGIAGTLAANALILIVLLIAVLRWRGFV
ncbi:hypothetical protein [Roseivivax jejudonensis]|nr:hypothetical protein [Roseivivax jejudonensis]